MDGAGKKLWGYYPTDKTWVPLQVDADGKVKVDLSAVNLDDLGDVSVASPTDQYFVYWDAATSLWKCKAIPAAAWADITGKPTAPSLEELATEHDAAGLHTGKIVLADADIPAAIARDAEVATAVSDHTALPSAHHTKYTDAEAKAAAVLAGAITDGETKAPTHDAVYDVKATADGAIAKSLLTERGSIIYRNATAPAELLHGTAGQVLQSGGHGADPSWASAPGGTKIQDADADTSWDVEQTADEDKVHGKVKGVEAFLLHDDGILDMAKQSCIDVYGSADQSLANATWTVMNLNIRVTDRQDEFNTTTHTFTAKRAGIYLISACIKCAGNSVDGQDIDFAITKNSTSPVASIFDVYTFAAAANKYVMAIGSTIVTLAATDVLYLMGYQTSGGAQTFIGNQGSMFLRIIKVA